MTETDHRLWIRNPLACSDPDAAGGIVVTGTRIVEKVAGGQQPHQPVDETFDASGHVLLPGLVNTHHHFYQTLTRAYSPALNKELFPWLTTLYDVWANLNDSQRLIDRYHQRAEGAITAIALNPILPKIPDPVPDSSESSKSTAMRPDSL